MLIALFSGLLLTSCSPRTKVIEDLQLIQAIGYDYENEEEFKAVAGSQIILSEEEALPNTEVFTAISNTARIARKKMQTESSKLLVLGRVNLVLFQDELAKQGIFYYLDILQRDPVIGRNVRPAVVEGTVYDLLAQKYNLDITVYQYLSELIEQSEREIFPEMTLHSLLYHYYDEGSDIYLPMIKQEKDRARVIGLALFKGDQFVHKLNVEGSSYLKMIKEPFSGGFYQIDLEDDNYVSIENVDVNQDFIFQRQDNNITANINVHIKGIINEQEDLVGSSHYNVSSLNHYGKKHFEDKIQKLIQTFQHHNIDPIGLGAKATSAIRDLDIKEWKQLYPDLDVQVQVDLEVISGGITEEE